MTEKYKQELQNLSSQMIDLFVSDIFSKNQVDPEKVKMKISDEQRETLRQSASRLKEQVETFVNDQNTSKTLTENDEDQMNQPVSLLRKKIIKKDKVESKQEQQAPDVKE